MNRKMYWGVAILILLFGTSAVFIIKHEIAENSGLKKQLAEAEKLKNRIKQQQALKDSPPPAEPGFKWVWRNDRWDSVPIFASENEGSASEKQNSIELPPDFPVVTGVAKIPFWERLGLDPPDGDMTYRKDKYGNYQKVYKGQAWYGEIKFEKGYAPSLEQYKKMQKLRRELQDAINAGDNSEVKRLESEIAALNEASQGDLPYYDGGGYLSKLGESAEEAKRNYERQRKEAKHQLYVEYGLEHISPYR